MPGPDHQSDSSSAATVGISSPSDRSRWLSTGPVLLTSLLLLVTLLGLLHIEQYPTLSPYDEIQHLDTLEKSSRFVFVGRGERLSQTTMRETACHGADFVWEFDTCDAETYDSAAFPWDGWNTAYTASPFYYTVTGVAGRAVDFATPGIDSLLTASRIIGLAWALAATAFVWLLLGEFSIPYWVRFFTILLIVTAPTVLHLSSIVNPDITGVVGGAAIAWLTLRWERGASPAWLLVVAGTLAVLGKPLNAVAVAVMVTYLVIRYLLQRFGAEHKPLPFPTWGVGALLGAMLLGAVPWVIVQGALASAPTSEVPMIIQFSGAPLTWADVTSQINAVVSPLRNPYVPAFIAGPLTMLIVAISDLFMIGGNIGVSLLSRDRRASVLATTTLTAALLLGPTIVVFVFVTLDGMVFPTTVRYGLPLLPMFAVGLAVAAGSKLPGRIALGVLATASLAVASTEMIGLM